MQGPVKQDNGQHLWRLRVATGSAGNLHCDVGRCKPQDHHGLLAATSAMNAAQWRAGEIGRDHYEVLPCADGKNCILPLQWEHLNADRYTLRERCSGLSGRTGDFE